MLLANNAGENRIQGSEAPAEKSTPTPMWVFGISHVGFVVSHMCKRVGSGVFHMFSCGFQENPHVWMGVNKTHMGFNKTDMVLHGTHKTHVELVPPVH